MPRQPPARQMKMVCDRMRVEVENVERRDGEDGAGHHAARGAAHAGDDHVLEHGGAPPVDARQADGEDGDGNRRLHSLADLEGGIGRCDAEDDAQQRAPQHRAPGDLRWRHAGGHQRHIDFAVLQRLVGVFREATWFRFRPWVNEPPRRGSSAGPSIMGLPQTSRRTNRPAIIP